MDFRQQLAWQPRTCPLAPSAALARGSAAARLADRLARLEDEHLKSLNAAWDTTGLTTLVIVTGPTELLPWVEGIEYYGADRAAPNLLLPVHLQPAFPPALLERAVALNGTALPALLCPEPPQLIGLRPCGAIARATLITWLRGAA